MEHEGVNTAEVLIGALIFSILLFVTIVVTFAGYRYAENAEVRGKKYTAGNDWLENIIAAQEAELGGYKVVDASSGKATIPIDDAIEIVAGENMLGARMANLAPPKMPVPEVKPAPRKRRGHR